MKKNKIKASSVKRVLKYIKKYSFLLIISVLLAVITVGLTLYIPIIIGDAIDLIIGKGLVQLDKIGTLLLNVGIISLIIALLQWVMNTINNKITFLITRDVRNEAFDKIENLPLKYIDSHQYGDVVSRIITDVDQLADGLLMGFTQLFTGITTIVGTLIFMLTLSPIITLVVVALTPLSLLVASFISKRTYSLFKLQSEARANQTAIIGENIGNLKVVKAFSHEDESLEEFDLSNEKLKKASIKAIFFSSLVNPTTRFVNALVYAGVALVGAFVVMGNFGTAITVGALSCFLSYANQYAKPFNEISGVVTELQSSLASAARVFELIDEEPQMPDDENALVLENALGSIDLYDVKFSYSPDKELIKNLTLRVEKGQRIAIVGPTGCGKTTLINLLMRFYDVNSGSISVDGTDIRNITRHSLRKNYGMVLQDTWIKSGTVRENIALGKPEATLDEVISAAKAAHAHSFIKRLPLGYDTVISEELGGLSQGQKQLLCIARIMLSIPPMLILDEATSSIDTRTEIKIQDAFALLMAGRTSFIVAHRLSTIKEADVILVMNKGNIIEQGSHKELLEKKGFYYNLYNSQFEIGEEQNNEKN
ncbi:MAG: ABC transporter ATP-binding protein [Clostridia bacterium]|nr:ABC transporter ATP-binding protein [Clostridia bacterium]